MYERAHQLGLPVHIEFNDPLTVTYHLGEHYSAKGTGFNQHSAKQFAAKRMLQILSSVKTRTNEGQPPTEINPVARLHQLAQAQHVELDFIEVNPASSEANFTIRVQFDQAELAEGYGKTKQLAKRAAAEIALEKLESVVVLPLAPSKGVLKRSEGNDAVGKHEKKHVHFADEVIEKDERASVRSSSSSSSATSTSCSRRQQLTNACQRMKIDVNYLDELVSADPSVSILILVYPPRVNRVILAVLDTSRSSVYPLASVFSHSFEATVHHYFEPKKTPPPRHGIT